MKIKIQLALIIKRKTVPKNYKIQIKQQIINKINNPLFQPQQKTQMQFNSHKLYVVVKNIYCILFFIKKKPFYFIKNIK